MTNSEQACSIAKISNPLKLASVLVVLLALASATVALLTLNAESDASSAQDAETGIYEDQASDEQSSNRTVTVYNGITCDFNWDTGLFILSGSGTMPNDGRWMTY